MKKLSSVLFMLLVFCAFTVAQKTVTGTVTDQSGESLIGANVVEKGNPNNGTITDIDGNFSVTVANNATLIISYTGYQTQEVDVSTSNSVNIILSEGQLIDEIVVTGVGKGTATKKLGFAVAKVNAEALEKVPGVDPGNALRGKAAGVRVVQPTGNPAASAQIRLRGSTSINGSQQPLIIVDGVLTSGDLRDINMDDVESIEVVKGAAASALYGSLAGNGVIQIITKTGAKGSGTKVTIRNEYGTNQIAMDYPSATRHPFALDPAGVRMGDWNGDGIQTSNFGFDLSSGVPTPDPDGRFDNEFQTEAFDNIDRFFTGANFYNNNISLATTEKNINYYLSFSNQYTGGLVDVLDPYKRRNFRANIDARPNDKFKIGFRSLYSTTDAQTVDQGGQGENLFFNLLTFEPFIDLAGGDTSNETGYDPQPPGYEISSTNAENPLYIASAIDRGFNRTRVLGGLTMDYNLTDDLVAQAAYSVDRNTTDFFFYRPKGFRDASAGANSEGSLAETRDETSKAVYSAQLQYSKGFGDMNAVATLKYLYEDDRFDRVGANGTEFATAGIRNLGALANQNISSIKQEFIAENTFFDLQLDYQDKLIIGGMIRNDGSSTFGENERRQWYYRGSLAYRLTEDMQINGIDEWKLRASYGTSGQRPPFSAQYEAFSVNRNGAARNTLGNADLRPSNVRELEVGTNMTFGGNWNFEANYAVTNTEDDYLAVPLSGVTGWNFQWQNVGNIRSTALEFSLGGQLVNKGNFSWDVNVFWDRIRQEITDLGGIPDFTRNTATAFPIFRVEEGLPYGTMYGNLAITDASQLSVNNEGHVLNNVGSNALAASRPLTVNDFFINSDGYLVPMTLDANGNVVESTGTVDEQVVYLADDEGNTIATQIGDTNPDFNIGLSSTVNFGGFSVYLLVDHQQGGDIYNYTKQLLYFNDRHLDQQTYAEQGKHYQYSNSASSIYNLASGSSHFVEDGTFTKVRELSVSYDFGRDALKGLGIGLKGLRVALTGRNLLTITDYTGFDPEVAISTNPTNFRFDEYAYPNFRTFTGAVTIDF